MRIGCRFQKIKSANRAVSITPPPTDRRPTDRRPPTDRLPTDRRPRAPVRPSDPSGRPTAPTAPTDRPDRPRLKNRPTVTLAATLEAIAATLEAIAATFVAAHRAPKLRKTVTSFWCGRLPSLRCRAALSLCSVPCVRLRSALSPHSRRPLFPLDLFFFIGTRTALRKGTAGVAEAAAREERERTKRCYAGARPPAPRWSRRRTLGRGRVRCFGKRKGDGSHKGEAGGINETCRGGRVSQGQVCRRVDNKEENKKTKGRGAGPGGRTGEEQERCREMKPRRNKAGKTGSVERLDKYQSQSRAGTTSMQRPRYLR